MEIMFSSYNYHCCISPCMPPGYGWVGRDAKINDRNRIVADADTYRIRQDLRPSP